MFHGVGLELYSADVVAQHGLACQRILQPGAMLPCFDVLGLHGQSVIASP